MPWGSAGLATELAPFRVAPGEFTAPRSAADGAEREAPGRGAAGLRGEEAGGIESLINCYCIDVSAITRRIWRKIARLV